MNVKMDAECNLVLIVGAGKLTIKSLVQRNGPTPHTQPKLYVPNPTQDMVASNFYLEHSKESPLKQNLDVEIPIKIDIPYLLI